MTSKNILEVGKLGIFFEGGKKFARLITEDDLKNIDNPQIRSATLFEKKEWDTLSEGRAINEPVALPMGGLILVPCETVIPHAN